MYLFEYDDENNHVVHIVAYGYEFVKCYNVTSLSPCLYNICFIFVSSRAL